MSTNDSPSPDAATPLSSRPPSLPDLNPDSVAPGSSPDAAPEASAAASTSSSTIAAAAGSADNIQSSATELVDRILAFLSSASPETLAAISIGGAAVLYVVLGKLGLLVIGVAAGAVGHAALGMKRDKSPSGVHELFERARQRIADGDGGGDGALLDVKPSAQTPDFSILPPETAKAFEELTDAAVRDYVRYYSFSYSSL